VSVVRSFHDLDVYQKAYQLSLDIHKATLGFPKLEQFALADQMRRASKSICANSQKALPSSELRLRSSAAMS